MPNTTDLLVRDLGSIAYEPALDQQRRAHEEVLAWRDRPDASPPGVLLLCEHDPPVITVSRRPDARAHLLADHHALAREGVHVCETDRGGDITYHGPGQLVAYPILDLNRLHWNVHTYVRALERVVMDVCERFGLAAHRDACATGVWTGPPPQVAASADVGCTAARNAKICAIGVRVRRWVTMHGLALNVDTNLDHFNLIVPCGLADRAVTSLRRELGDATPPMAEVKDALTRVLAERLAGGA